MVHGTTRFFLFHINVPQTDFIEKTPSFLDEASLTNTIFATHSGSGKTMYFFNSKCLLKFTLLK
ncbi:hypothetical protein BTR23_23140 [Alkalihalophilus pseudofirmus]|nr:hypothetical protein BTR23_23140 [Alkalihalophilus pseudofirmus]